MLLSLLSQWRWAAVGLLVAAVGIFAWEANGWRERARENAALQEIIRMERERSRKAEEARAVTEAALQDAVGSVEVQVKEVIKRVPQIVRVGGECGLGRDGVRLLNQARGYVPDAPGAVAGPVAAASAP